MYYNTVNIDLENIHPHKLPSKNNNRVSFSNVRYNVSVIHIYTMPNGNYEFLVMLNFLHYIQSGYTRL